MTFTMIAMAHKYRAALRMASGAAPFKFSTLSVFLISHFSAIQRRALEQWYSHSRATSKNAAYIPVPLYDSSGQSVQTTGFTRIICNHHRLWIEGASGMGKTAFVEWLYATYFFSNTLSIAYKKHGYIPVLIRLREFASPLKFESSKEQWILELASQSIGYTGFASDSQKLLRKIFEDEQFVLIIDGYHEINDDGGASLLSPILSES